MVGMLARENDSADAIAARSFLDQHPQAAAAWRSHQWLWSAATSPQLDEAIRKADEELSIAENDLPAQLETHNKRDRPMMGMSPIALDEFRQLVRQLLINLELMNMMATGAPQ